MASGARGVQDGSPKGRDAGFVKARFTTAFPVGARTTSLQWNAEPTRLNGEIRWA